MKQLPSRHRRLDEALAGLPVEEPMLLTELDGFLTGIVLGPEPVASAEWLQSGWGSDESGVPPFEEPADVEWFAAAVIARHDEIVRDLKRAKLHPIFDVDDRNGDVLWDYWIDGFAEAMALRDDAWAALAASGDVPVSQALSRLATLIAIARNQSDLDSREINALEDQAPSELVNCIVQLHAAQVRLGAGANDVSVGQTGPKVGRNDPCSCGSGRKYKRCCA